VTAMEIMVHSGLVAHTRRREVVAVATTNVLGLLQDP
jgi:hypothetical protein